MPPFSECLEKPGLARNAPDLSSYDTIIVAFSGGKDSIACLISLIEAGVPPERVELYHHEVDGHPLSQWRFACISRNYADRNWRVACDPGPFEQRPTFKTREQADMAEWELVQALPVNYASVNS